MRSAHQVCGIAESLATIELQSAGVFSCRDSGQWSERRERQFVVIKVHGVTHLRLQSSIGLYRKDQASHGLRGPWPGPASWPGGSYSVAAWARSRTLAVVPTYMSRVMR